MSIISHAKESGGVYTTKMAKHAGTKVKAEEKYKVTATQTHIIYKFAWRTRIIKNICLINQIGGGQSSAALTTFFCFPGTKMLEYGIKSGISYVLAM